MSRAPEHGLRFYETSHRYKLDGTWVQGVTTLIKQGLPNDALKYWAARFVAEYVADNRALVGSLFSMGRGPMVAALKEAPFQYRDEAAIQGTNVHAFAQRIASGEEVEVPERLVGYVEGCLGFLEDYDIKPDLIETCVGSREHRYAGTLDLVANGAIWDYKTSASGIWPETAFQLSAYAYAEFYGQEGDEHPLPAITDAYGVHLPGDGSYAVLPLEFGEHVFREFLAIAQVARIAKRAKGSKNEPGYVKAALEPPHEETA